MAELNNTTFAAALKELFPEDVIQKITFQNHPALGMMEKVESGGESTDLVVRYANPQNASATFATASAATTSSSLAKFQLTMADYYSLGSISRKTILSSKNNEMAVARAAESEIEAAFDEAAHELAKSIYAASGGAIGQVGSESTTSLTLKDINDVVNFQVGMELQADTVNGGGTVHTGTATVTAVNLDTGVLTSDSNWTTQISSLAADDFLFRDGDYDLRMSGFDSWLPTSAPGATAFFGVDRSVDTVRLGGHRHTGTSQTVEEALLTLATKISRIGGRPDVALINDVQFRNLVTSVGSKQTFEATQMPAKGRDGENASGVFFSGININGPRGPMKVFPDFSCPAQRGYVLTWDQVALYSLEEAPHIFDLDNPQELLRKSSADSYEVRTGWYAQLGIKKPGYCGVVTLPAATF